MFLRLLFKRDWKSEGKELYIIIASAVQVQDVL